MLGYSSHTSEDVFQESASAISSRLIHHYPPSKKRVF